MFNVSYVAGGRLDAPHYPTFRAPYMKGIYKVVKGGEITTIEYEVPFTGELYAISIDCSLYENDDRWDLLVDDEVVCKDIYVKRAPEGVNLMAFIPVYPGTKISIKFTTIGVDKVVWSTLHFLKDGDFTKPGGLSPITVDKPVIRIHLIDDGNEDGDILSLYVNGALIKEKHFLVHDQPIGVNGTHYVEVPLQRGDNNILFVGESPGAVGSYLTAKFRITDNKGNELFAIEDLPSLRMRNDGVTGIKGDNWYTDPKPEVSWVVNRTV